MAGIIPVSEEMNRVKERSGWDTVRGIAKTAVKYGKYPAALIAGLLAKDAQVGSVAFSALSGLENALSWGEQSSAVIKPGQNAMTGASFNVNLNLKGHAATPGAKGAKVVLKADVMYRIRRILDIGLDFGFDNIQADDDNVVTWLSDLKQFLEETPGELVPADTVVPSLDSRFLADVSGIQQPAKRIK